MKLGGKKKQTSNTCLNDGSLRIGSSQGKSYITSTSYWGQFSKQHSKLGIQAECHVPRELRDQRKVFRERWANWHLWNFDTEKEKKRKELPSRKAGVPLSPWKKVKGIDPGRASGSSSNNGPVERRQKHLWLNNSKGSWRSDPSRDESPFERLVNGTNFEA